MTAAIVGTAVETNDGAGDVVASIATTRYFRRCGAVPSHSRQSHRQRSRRLHQISRSRGTISAAK